MHCSLLREFWAAVEPIQPDPSQLGKLPRALTLRECCMDLQIDNRTFVLYDFSHQSLTVHAAVTLRWAQ
jgi:hypothetical protein